VPANEPGGDRSKRGAARGAGHSKGRRPPITAARGGALPKWVREEVTRSTPKARRDPALRALTAAVGDFADERFGAAARALRDAKALAPRAATIRELLGLASYREERWEESLRELRTFRRLTGETTHMPLEIDCLRAMKRPEGVEKAWELFCQLGGARTTEDEARVVFASFLLDRGEVRRAWDVIRPGRLVADAPASALRRWYVAARVAVASGDTGAAAKFATAIRNQDPEMPGLGDLESEIARVAARRVTPSS